jgi:hypothetical protein
MTTRRSAKGKVQPRGTSQRRKAASAQALALLELRSYAMAKGQRDVLNTMFEEHFLDAYEAAGARILGVFHDAENPDRWIWIRAFPDPTARARALKGFYGSEEWLARRAAANRTIRSSSDAILLTPRLGSFDLLQAPATRRVRPPQSIIECTRCFLKTGEDQEQVAGFVQQEVLPLLGKLGAMPVAVLVNSDAPNLYPRARLRSGEAVVWLLRFPSAAAHARHLTARAASGSWTEVEQELQRHLKRPAEHLKLLPQRRSALR